MILFGMVETVGMVGIMCMVEKRLRMVEIIGVVEAVGIMGIVWMIKIGRTSENDVHVKMVKNDRDNTNDKSGRNGEDSWKVGNNKNSGNVGNNRNSREPSLDTFGIVQITISNLDRLKKAQNWNIPFL